MIRAFPWWAFALAASLLFSPALQAEQHRATRLGHPATRFAPPLRTPDDLRARFRDEKLRPDIASILKQWGWTGDLNDLHRAAQSAPILDIKIPVGSTMPFMSSRENGKPICLRNVLWAGQEPAPAYAFDLLSKGRRYRCVTPKACSNFFLEDLGAEPRFGLALQCSAPQEVLAGRPVEVCLTVRNTGNQPEANTAVTLSVPAGAQVARTSEGGVSSGSEVMWEVRHLAPGAAKRVCAYFAMRQPALLSFSATARGGTAKPVQTTCSTRVAGVPAILIEVIDLEDPIEIGKEVTYDIKVTNQGSATGSNIRLACRLPASQEFVSGTGVTHVHAEGRVLTTATLAELAPKAVASWRVVVKAAQPDDARFRVELTSTQFQVPIEEEESTQLY